MDKTDLTAEIGHTPLLELPSLSPRPGVRVYAKLESYNPTGSVKDRIALSMLDAAEESGALSPGQIVLEPTSGNTGIALALLCLRRGYPLRVVMPENATAERKQLLSMYGAEIIDSPASEGSNGAVRVAQELAAADPALYMPYQYGNPANPLAHYNGTALEILEQLEQLSIFVAGLGTGGTLMGCGRRLREELGENVQIVAAEPRPGEGVQGLRSLADGFVPPILDISLLDRKILVDNSEAVVYTRRLLAEEGLFLGVSSGAAACVASRVADKLEEGNVVFVAADDGWRYLSSGVYTLPLDRLADIDNAALW